MSDSLTSPPGLSAEEEVMMGGADTPEVFLARTKSFTRRMRGMKPALAAQFAEVEADYVVEVPRGLGKTTVAEDCALEIPEIFGRVAPLYVEVGSGRGEQTVGFAEAHPEVNVLALEVWRPGIARLAVAAAAKGLANVKIIEADAEQALPLLLEEGSVEEVWTFFPDPWRKARHHKRRLVSSSFAAAVARVLTDGGRWRLATDWEDYADQMLQVLSHAPDFVIPERDEDGAPTFSPRFAGRVLTHFERRAEDAGRPARDLTAVRLPRGD